MRKNNKASLFGNPLIIFLAALLIGFIIYLTFFYSNKSNVFTVEDVEKKIGDNLFLIGMLRSEVDFNNQKMPLSELISRYNIDEGQDIYSSAIKSHVNKLMIDMYQKKICYVLTTPKGDIKEDSDDCQLVKKGDEISSKVMVPGFNSETFEVSFEMRK